MKPTGRAQKPMTMHTAHSPPVRFMNPMAGPTTVRPTPSMNAACVPIVRKMMKQKMGESWMPSKTFHSVIFLLLISEKICMKTKVLKMTELTRRVL